MSNIIEKPTVKLKTYTICIHNKNDKRILDYSSLWERIRPKGLYDIYLKKYL